MSRLWLWISAFILTQSVGATPLIDEGFEAQSAPEWQAYGLDPAMVSYTVDASLAHGATTLLNMKKPSASEWSFLWRHINDKATWGSIITIKAWVKNDNAVDCQAFVAVSVKDQATAAFQTGANNSIRPGVTWQPVEVTFTVPSQQELPQLGTSNIEVSFGLRGVGCVGPVLFDDVTVEIKE